MAAERVQIAIVGAGPAGMAAALRLLQGGVTPTLLDEAGQAGGQVYRGALAHPGYRAPGIPRAGRALLEAFAAQCGRMDYRPRCSVWGVFGDGRTLGLLSEDGRDTDPAKDGDAARPLATELRADAVLFAPGALERVTPFPGWTLPGVYAAGAVQLLLKTHGLLPGRRVLVAGSGPLPLLLAGQLARAGAAVPCVLEAARPRPSLATLAALAGAPGLAVGGVRERLGLVLRGIPWRTGHALAAVRPLEAGGGLRAVVTRLASVGPSAVESSAPTAPHDAETLDVDAVAVGHGFLPNCELTRLAGCAHSHDPDRGGWRPVTDALMATSVRGVFSAGDGAGIAGADAARLRGELAALGLLAHLGRLTPAAARREAQPCLRKLRRLVRAQAALWGLFALPITLAPSLLGLIAPETPVCRCEGVTRATVDAALDDGLRGLDTLKRVTRAGMGLCQGRYCAPTLDALAAARYGEAQAADASVQERGWLNPRPPLRPLPLGALTGLTGLPGSPAQDEQG